MKRIIDGIDYNKNALDRKMGMSILDRGKFYEEQYKINYDEDERAKELMGEAKPFIKQFSEMYISIHCILKNESSMRKIEKEDASAIIPENFIEEPRKSFAEPKKKEEKKMEIHVGKIKRHSYVAFLH